jgi:hypothetical protein
MTAFEARPLQLANRRTGIVLAWLNAYSKHCHLGTLRSRPSRAASIAILLRIRHLPAASSLPEHSIHYTTQSPMDSPNAALVFAVA